MVKAGLFGADRNLFGQDRRYPIDYVMLTRNKEVWIATRCCEW